MEPQLQTSPLPITKAMILTWANSQIIQYGNGSVSAQELWTLSKHDIIRNHGLT